MEDPFAESTSKQEDEIANMTTRIVCDESEWSIAEVSYQKDIFDTPRYA